MIELAIQTSVNLWIVARIVVLLEIRWGVGVEVESAEMTQMTGIEREPNGNLIPTIHTLIQTAVVPPSTTVEALIREIEMEMEELVGRPILLQQLLSMQTKTTLATPMHTLVNRYGITILILCVLHRGTVLHPVKLNILLHTKNHMAEVPSTETNDLYLALPRPLTMPRRVVMTVVVTVLIVAVHMKTTAITIVTNVLVTGMKAPILMTTALTLPPPLLLFSREGSTRRVVTVTVVTVITVTLVRAIL